MDAVVGLGKAGCAVADTFSQYPQYEVYKIDSGIEESSKSFNLQEQPSSEEYERNCPDMASFFAEFDTFLL